MGQAFFTSNETIKIKGIVGSGYTVLANEYVIATYKSFNNGTVAVSMAQVYYATGDTVAASITGTGTATLTQDFLTAVAFKNSP